MLQTLTPFQRHCDKWSKGCGSDECQNTRKIFARGKVPCGILFVGEAPGESEDSLGYPFVGPAGMLQDDLLDFVNIRTRGMLESTRVGFCNLVCCIPRAMNRDGIYGKIDEPSYLQIIACRRRLEEFITICNPTLVVAVGKLSEVYLEQDGSRDMIRMPPSVKEIIQVIHPAAILRGKTAQQSLMKQRYVTTVTTAVERHFGSAK